MSDNVSFFVPDIGEDEIEAVARVLRSGRLVGGPEVAAFESEFAQYLGLPQEKLVSVNSATAGLHLCLAAMGIGLGDEVIVPTVTFSATAEVVDRVGAKPVFIDIDSETFCMSLADVREKITHKTRAIIPVHHSGRACDMAGLLELKKQHGIAIIEDAAHAFPTFYDGKCIGTLESDATVFSFYANKTITTGDGGMIATHNRSLADKCRLLRQHGMKNGTKEEILNGVLYDIEQSGYKYNMTDMAAAMGRVQLAKSDEMTQKRRMLVALYRQKLTGLPLLLPALEEENSKHAWHLFVVRVKGDNQKERRNKILQRFEKEQIGFSIHYRPLHQHSYWKKYIPKGQSFPAADHFYDAAISLPLYSKMPESYIDRVCDVLADVLR